MLESFWDNGVASAGAVAALALGIWISPKAVGLLDRPKHELRAQYLPPENLPGLFAMPHFIVEYETPSQERANFSRDSAAGGPGSDSTTRRRWPERWRPSKRAGRSRFAASLKRPLGRRGKELQP